MQFYTSALNSPSGSLMLSGLLLRPAR